MDEFLFTLIMMAVNFVIVVIWYQQLVRGLVAAGVAGEELGIAKIWLIQYKRASNDVKGELVKFYFKLFVLFLVSLALKFIVGF
ncbi:hypothetical protein [uncultured Sneathiella sp.]|uniref:hypothetical protein n=1 Tax=uncultured Sneathiella sp. TaxID=879315 RepID=UPI00259887D9|nr:hypothetical protein [uncultured Sneathiella sp.]